MGERERFRSIAFGRGVANSSPFRHVSLALATAGPDEDAAVEAVEADGRGAAGVDRLGSAAIFTSEDASCKAGASEDGSDSAVADS